MHMHMHNSKQHDPIESKAAQNNNNNSNKKAEQQRSIKNEGGKRNGPRSPNCSTSSALLENLDDENPM